MSFKAVLALPKTASSAQINKSISFIGIVWSTLYVYLWSQYELNYWTSWLYILFFRTNLVSILGKNGQMAIVAMSTLKVVMRPKNIVLDGLWEIPTTIMSIYWKNHAWASSYAAKGPHRRYNRDLLSQISIMDLKLKKDILLPKIVLTFSLFEQIVLMISKFLQILSLQPQI